MAGSSAAAKMHAMPRTPKLFLPKPLVIALFALLLALAGGGGAGAQQIGAGVSVRAPDGFYDSPLDASRQPGALLRSEPLSNVTLPAGMRAWRILYATSVDDRTPATAVAIVYAPITPPAGPRPVIAWAHATTGLVQRCMPSLLSSPTEGMPARDRVVSAGWVVVATDYSFAERDGPHPFLIGEGEARAVLDSVRAARHMPELSLDARTVVWGHSQGGHAALWSGIVAPRYAPDINVVGVVAISPAAGMADILALNPEVERGVGPYVARAYSRFYPDIKFEEVVRPEALPAAREFVNLCGFIDSQRIGELAASYSGPALAANAAFAARIAENTPNHPIAAPLLIAQGIIDVVVPFPATDAYVQDRCAAGQRLEYWRFTNLGHGAIVSPGSEFENRLMSWTRARFAGQRQANGCHRTFY
jgi:acetyl esterase/lipase